MLIQQDQIPKPYCPKLIPHLQQPSPSCFETRIGPWRISTCKNKKTLDRIECSPLVRSPNIGGNKYQKNKIERYASLQDQQYQRVPSHKINSDKLLRIDSTHKKNLLNYQRRSVERRLQVESPLNMNNQSYQFDNNEQQLILEKLSYPFHFHHQERGIPLKTEQCKARRIPVYRQFNFIRNEKNRRRIKERNRIQVSSIRLKPLSISPPH